MPMTVVVTRDVLDRYRGFLASAMPEVAPGVYVSPELSRGVRERIWGVVAQWWQQAPGGSLLMAWKDDSAPGRLGLATLGLPPVMLADVEGVLLARKELQNSELAPAASSDPVLLTDRMHSESSD
jgi:CRISPR-associated protein Cas2